MNPFFKKIPGLLVWFRSTRDSRDLRWLERIKTPVYQKWLIGVSTAAILTLLISPTLRLTLKEYRIGEIATKEVRSSQDLLVEDEKSTREKRIEAERSVFSVYDYDPGVPAEVEARIREALQGPVPSTKEERANHDSGIKRRTLESFLHVTLSQREWQLLEKQNVAPPVGETLLSLVVPVLTKGVVNDKDLLDPDAFKGVVIRNIKTREERRTLPPFSFFDLREAKSKVRSQAEILGPTLGKELSSLLVRIAESLLRPNLTFNKSETENRKVMARDDVAPVYFQVKRGDIIIRAGERAREDHLFRINALRKAQQRGHILGMVVGLGLLTLLILVSLYQFSTQNIRKFILSQKDLLLFSSTLVGMLAFLKVFQLVTETLGGEFLSIPATSYVYLFPFAAGAMLLRIVINSEVAIVFALMNSLFSAALMGNQLSFFIFTLIGSVVGAHKVAHCEQRSILIKAGVLVGGTNVLALFAIHLISGSVLTMLLVADFILGFLGGVFASILVLGIVPIVEGVFGYTTDIKLLELANMDNPLLKDLMVQAPGTYHHSVIVGTLVEAAAKSIAANPLLARVSAYYHDIGKLKKPLYFVENAGGMESKHDHLAPTMSNLILISHVKDGLELAHEKHLGPRIAHIIQQHHGTSLISYFYQKAKVTEDSEMDPLNEGGFRYPGPKPQTKEAGIVMLADAVEATSRTLTDPTSARLKGLVQEIINTIFTDGQLEECELTLKDLHNIEESFSRVLTGIFHRRIDYPTATVPEPARKKSDEDLDSKSAKTYPFRPKKLKKSG